MLGARQAVYADSGLRHNTWGAYQCYGDPQWRLVPPAARVAHPQGTSRLREAQHCMSADELARASGRWSALPATSPPRR